MPELLRALDGVERLGKQAIGERVINHEIRDFEELRVTWLFDAIALQGSEIVGVTEFGAELLEELPVARGAFGTNFILKMTLQVIGDAVVVNQRVVDVKEENGARAGVLSIHGLAIIN